MDKLVYQRSNNSKEPQKINFEFKDDITAYEFRNICVRMASALGYSNGSIENAFPKPKDNQHEVDKRQLKLLFD
jgi:hypothetical protein|tara:strand:+ start:293 stop:514 length:222 start_codon:yes stop_codon:yes gene_type:complete